MEKGLISVDLSDLRKRHELLGHKSVNFKLPTVIRVNTLRIREDVLVERLKKSKVVLKKIPYLKFAYSAKSSFSLGAIPEYLLGYFYLQEAASQAAVEVLNPEPGEIVLDCCAAPGGKTTQIAQLMENKGLVVAFDNKSRRILSLKSNLERCNVQNAAVFLRDITHASNEFGNFDKILIDAPCSGNYVVDPDWFDKTDINSIGRAAYRQYDIVQSVINHFANKNTEIVYSTCSLEPEENEFLIQRLIDDFNIELLKVGVGLPALTNIFGKELDKDIAKCARFWPDVHGTQAFFIAKFKVGVKR